MGMTARKTILFARSGAGLIAAALATVAVLVDPTKANVTSRLGDQKGFESAFLCLVGEFGPYCNSVQFRRSCRLNKRADAFLKSVELCALAKTKTPLVFDPNVKNDSRSELVPEL
jgi:hypothetical protein